MLKYIFLGIVQGFTEFFPVSSSGHLVIVQNILGVNENVIFLDLVLHLGTLCSVLVFFKTDIFILITNFLTAIFDILFRGRVQHVFRYDDKFRLVFYIGVATFVTAYIGITFKDFFQGQYESINTVIAGLFFTGCLLLLTKRYNFGQRYLRHILVKDSIIAGIVQGLAILPGVSRSGITISTLLFRNINRESAFKFSFLYYLFHNLTHLFHSSCLSFCNDIINDFTKLLRRHLFWQIVF